jgi:crotonobetainyl-CoA:carnitine CoA-transferase CaiB-like acyl-CoA transferase
MEVTEDRSRQDAGALAGLRVVELGDESAEYCGVVLAGLGAEVVKVEPPGGAPSRAVGPFLDGAPDPERSIFFSGINPSKTSTPSSRARAQPAAIVAIVQLGLLPLRSAA